MKKEEEEDDDANRLMELVTYIKNTYIRGRPARRRRRRRATAPRYAPALWKVRN